MSGLKYKIRSENYEVEITELSNIEQLKVEPDALVIYDDDISKASTVLKIIIEDYLIIYYYFEAYSSGLQDFTVLVIPETHTVLIGGKKKSCSVNMINKKTENEFEHCLFWDFSLLNNGYVFESGELDCILRDRSGKIIDKVPVDPPWESDLKDDGIRFSSTLYGETFLRFPK